MKKLFSIIALVFIASVNSFSANNGSWTVSNLEADELKGEEAGTVFKFTDPSFGSFVFWGEDCYQFRLVCTDGLFNTESGYSRYTGSYDGMTVFVGIYDGNGKMKEKFKMWLDKTENAGYKCLETRNAGSMGNPVGQKAKVKKIFKALNEKDGYVRIVAERFENSDFDLKITPLTHK